MEILAVVFIFVAIEAGLYGICCFMCREKPVPKEVKDDQKEDADDLASLRSSCSWY